MSELRAHAQGLQTRRRRHRHAPALAQLCLRAKMIVSWTAARPEQPHLIIASMIEAGAHVTRAFAVQATTALLTTSISRGSAPWPDGSLPILAGLDRWWCWR